MRMSKYFFLFFPLPPEIGHEIGSGEEDSCTGDMENSGFGTGLV